jgi:hypothetical protein
LLVLFAQNYKSDFKKDINHLYPTLSLELYLHKTIYCEILGYSLEVVMALTVAFDF